MQPMIQLVEEVLVCSDLVMDLGCYRVRCGGRMVHLGPTEFRLLRLLMQHPGRVFSREQLRRDIWGHEIYVEPRTIDVHIGRLRRALSGAGRGELIRTVRSAGYMLVRQAGGAT